jgi:putative ABC transport system permease protein
VKALDRKLVRDLGSMRGQVVTIALVVASAIAIFVAAMGAHQSLVGARADYYRATRFADVFASLKRAPDALEPQLAELPGIGQLETRLVKDVTIDLPGVEVPISGRMIALPERGAARLDRLYLRRGRLPEPNAPDEVLASEAFAEANALRPGSHISAILNGKLQDLRIVGIALSPEYVFATRAGEPLPDDKRFGIFWMGHEAMAKAFDLDGAFNDIVASLAPGANEAAVLAGLDRLLGPYGGLVAYGRYDHPSNRYLSDEITQQAIMATTIPVIFLAVAAFLLNAVLGRLIRTQREQIAALKALGYGNSAIAGHYLKFVAAIVMAGALLGVGAGVLLGRMMTENYTLFFRFPLLGFRLEPWVALLATGISLLAGIAGALFSVGSVVRLAPAEAMRPPAPVIYRHGLLDRIGWIAALPARRRMMLRGITGRPLRTAMTSLGIAFAVSIVMISFFWQDALDYLIAVQFSTADRSDATVTFTGPVRGRAWREIERLPGVISAEGFRSVPVRLRAGQRSYRTAISGIPDGARLRQLLDVDLHFIPVPPDGLLLSRRLGERLGIGLGDTVTVEVLEADRPVRRVPVAAFVNDMIGLAAYMNLDALNRLMREGDAINSVAIAVDSHHAAELYRQLKALPKVETVSIKRLALQTFRETTALLVLVMSVIFAGFSIVIAVGVVYNNARIALQERAWELASLRVLGFTRAEVSRLLLAEITAEVAIAIPAGLGIGAWLVRLLVAWHETEMFKIPAVIAPRTYAVAAAIVVLAAAASALIVRRRIDTLDLVAVLKTRE